MLKIQDAVEKIVVEDDEVLSALSRDFINLSAYAKQIQGKVGELTKKEVGVPSIIVSLSRVKKQIQKKHPLIQDVTIENITTHAPLSEISYYKSPEIISKVSSLYKKIETSPNEFFTVILSTNDLTVICTERLSKLVIEHFKIKPEMKIDALAAIGISIDEKYYPMPNITYSFLRKIAVKQIALAETITSHREIIFVFKQNHLPEVLQLFSSCDENKLN